MKTIAFCPAHITGFFKAELDQNKTENIGSLGAGFSIQDGVTTTIQVEKSSKKDFQIEISGYQPDNLNVSKFVIKKFLELIEENYFVSIHHNILIPVGYGLGCSGAVALSLAIALNQALKTNLPQKIIGQIAHNAEINCKTGLGDVLASYYGGFEIRTKSGAPGIGIVEKIHTNYNSVIVICFSPISTNQFMKEKMSSINGLGGKMVTSLIQSKDCDEFQDMSVEFAKYIRMVTPKMKKVITDLHRNGIKCGVALFGETIFTLIPNAQEEKVLDILKKYTDGIIIKSKIDNLGARLSY